MADNRTAFEVFDSDGDGCLSQEEAGHVLRSMGHNPSEKQLAELCATLPNPDKITSAEFARLTMSASKPTAGTAYEKELNEAFRVFDRDENGLITENELRVIFTTLGEPIDTDDINALVSQLQVNDQGKVKYADFIKILLSP